MPNGESILIFGRPEPGPPAMWGSAAWAQTQPTPGVSVLAAPLQMCLPARTRGRRFHSRETVELFAAMVVLVAGMFLLEDRPVIGVLAALGGMALLLRTTAKICKRERIS